MEDHYRLIPVGWRPPTGGSVTTDDDNCCLPYWQPTSEQLRPLSNQHMEKKTEPSIRPSPGAFGGSQTRQKTNLIDCLKHCGAVFRQLLEAPRRSRQAVNSVNFDVD